MRALTRLARRRMTDCLADQSRGCERAQQLRHKLLILRTLEARLHHIRRRHDLTERQRGRKYFDQNRQ
jgi:hypothetical protein